MSGRIQIQILTTSQKKSHREDDHSLLKCEFKLQWTKELFALQQNKKYLMFFAVNSKDKQQSLLMNVHLIHSYKLLDINIYDEHAFITSSSG